MVRTRLQEALRAAARGKPVEIGFDAVSACHRRQVAKEMRCQHSSMLASKGAWQAWEARHLPYEESRAPSPSLDTGILEGKVHFAVASFLEYANRAACQSADPERRARALALKFGRRWKIRAAALAYARRVAERLDTQKNNKLLPAPRGARVMRAKRPNAFTMPDPSADKVSRPFDECPRAQEISSPLKNPPLLSMSDLSRTRRRSTPGRFATHYEFFEETKIPDGTSTEFRQASKQRVENLRLAVLPPAKDGRCPDVRRFDHL